VVQIETELDKLQGVVDAEEMTAAEVKLLLEVGGPITGETELV
jgi:hypothetical protein